MNEKSVPQFTNNLKHIDRFSQDLSASSLFIAGRVHSSGKLGLEQVLPILKNIQNLNTRKILTDIQRAAIQFRLFNGQIEKVNQFLQKFQENALKRPRPQQVQLPTKKITKLDPRLPEQVLQLIADLKEEQAAQIRRLKEEQEAKVQADLEAARKVQQQIQRELAERKERQRVQIVCGICHQVVPEQDYMPLQTCAEMFHALCIANHIERSIRTKVFPILCPSCDKELQIVDIRERVAQDIFDTFEKLSLNAYMDKHNSSVCPGCDFRFARDGNDNFFSCPQCQKDFCLECMVIYHQGQTCYEFQNPGVANNRGLFANNGGVFGNANGGQFGNNRGIFGNNNGGLFGYNNFAAQGNPFLAGGKNCPNCRRYNMRMGGNKVQRCACGAQYCFICLSTWGCLCQFRQLLAQVYQINCRFQYHRIIVYEIYPLHIELLYSIILYDKMSIQLIEQKWSQTMMGQLNIYQIQNYYKSVTI